MSEFCGLRLQPQEQNAGKIRALALV